MAHLIGFKHKQFDCAAPDCPHSMQIDLDMYPTVEHQRGIAETFAWAIDGERAWCPEHRDIRPRPPGITTTLTAPK